MISVGFNYQPASPGIRERRVINTYDAITTPVYSVFATPSYTFPPHAWYDEPGMGLTTIPWYEIIDNAVYHVTKSGAVTGVTLPTTAMVNLTTDLYENNWGDHYNPSRPWFYACNLDTDAYPDDPHAELRFDLWGMAHAPIEGDCQDFSAYLARQARSLYPRAPLDTEPGVRLGHRVRLAGRPR